jgi:hypothetical protein
MRGGVPRLAEAAQHVLDPQRGARTSETAPSSECATTAIGPTASMLRGFASVGRSGAPGRRQVDGNEPCLLVGRDERDLEPPARLASARGAATSVAAPAMKARRSIRGELRAERLARSAGT